MNNIVVHFADGRIEKGFTRDFFPNKTTFHLISPDDPNSIQEIDVSELKAIFFVRDLEGNPEYVDKKGFDPDVRAIGKRLRITFKDGEVFYGISQAFHPDATGFFVTPVDPDSNNTRAFIVNASVDSSETL